MKKTFLIVVCAIFSIFSIVFCFGCTNDLGEKIGQATITIECKTILDNMEKVETGLLESGVIPKDGIILQDYKVDVFEKDSIYTLLKRVCEQNKIQLDCTYGGAFQTHYIRAINHIYEMSVGESSGWMYFVDGKEPNKGISQFKLVGGEKIKIAYTCNIGDLQ